jgi:uncharacterized protein YdhG (YjbR/CyaY superfamily)
VKQSTSVAKYLAAQPPAARRVLARVLARVRYGIPTYKLDGRLVLCFAGWKEHWSLYPVSGLAGALLAALGERVVSKGTIRFLWSEPVPLRLLARIARGRARSVAVPATSRSRAARAPSRRGGRGSPRRAGAATASAP